MNRYRELFALPSVAILAISAFPARIAYGMIALATFFKAQQETGSVAIAGLAIGLETVSSSVSAGFRGSIMDKWGQKWPLRIFVPGYASLILVLNSMHSQSGILIVAFALGISAPPINLSVRPLWKDIVAQDLLRSAYALDTAMMSTTAVIGPVLATTIALSSHPGYALGLASLCMAIGGAALGFTSVSRNWIPEKKAKGQEKLWQNRAIQLLMIEGSFIGFGWGMFDVVVPAFSTQENVPQRTAWIFAAMGIFNVLGGLIGGLVSKRTSSLSSLRRVYLAWFILTLPLAFTYPGWSMAIFASLIGLVGGMGQVFYFEVLEAVRPLGSQTSSLGWIWSVEGTFMSIGAALGGWICENISPRLGLSITTLATAFGMIILHLGRKRLAGANRIPGPEKDLQAMKDNLTERS